VTLSLRGRFLLAQVLVVTTSLAIVTFLTAREERRWVAQRAAETLERAARRAVANLARAPEAAARDWPALAASIGSLLGCRVTLIDATGVVRGDSEVSQGRLALLENHAGRPEVRAALQGRAGSSTRHSRTLGLNLLYVAVPVRDVPAIAVLRLAEPLHRVTSPADALLRSSLIAAVVALLLSVPLILWAVQRQAARIRELQRVTHRLGGGEAGVRAAERPDDELGRLGRSINDLASERRTRLETLERERDEREVILAHLSDGVGLLDGYDRVLRMNRSLCDLLGRSVPAEPGTSFREFARAPGLEELIRAARQDGRTMERELRLGSPPQRLVRATVTPFGKGAAAAVLLVIHDLSEQEALNRVRQDFVANAAHELRTPLTSLRGYAETLLEGGLEDTRNREGFVRIIRDQATRLEDLLQDLLSLAELERPGSVLATARFDLRDLAREQVAAFHPRAARSGLDLELTPGSGLEVEADRMRLSQVIANLIDNALKYTDRGGIRVSLGQREAHAWCEVADTGPGISEEHLPRVFERFYRVDRARSRVTGGTGLGLSIVKHIVELHGGQVSVRSAVGQGSTFAFEIPREPASPGTAGA
jgi:two-component system phosphate regulon sensor histidine kinase PhoR